MKKFTVNKIPFEVTQNDYDDHFLMADVDNEHGRFEGIDDYTLTETYGPDDIKKTLTLFLRDLPDLGHDIIDPFTGVKYDVDYNSKYYDQQRKSNVNPELLIEFVDKYIKNPKEIIKGFVHPLWIYEEHFNTILKGKLEDYSYIEPIIDLINRAIPDLFVYFPSQTKKNSNIISLSVMMMSNFIYFNVFGGEHFYSVDNRMRTVLKEVTRFMHEHNLRPKFGNRAIQLYFDYCFDLYEIFGTVNYEQSKDDMLCIGASSMERMKQTISDKISKMSSK